MERNDNQFAQKQNKGFNVFIGETYVGHMVINEDRVDPKVVASLQDPAKMKQILSNAQLDLKIFVPKELREKRDTSALTDILDAPPAEKTVDAGAGVSGDATTDASTSVSEDDLPLGDETASAEA